MNVFLSAGEASGDAHAAALARAVLAGRPDIRLRGIGGPRMAGAGVELLGSLHGLQAMGLFEAAGTIPAHLRALRTIVRELREQAYDLVVLVDYPGFHRRVAGIAHGRGVPVLQYVAPQLWAWGAWRLGGYRRVVTHTAVILPFEEAFFRARGVAATFVGHPLLERRAPEREAARRALDLPDGLPVLGLFPGSRASEVRALWPSMREAARHLRATHPDLRVCVAADQATPLPGLDTIAAARAPAATVAGAADVAIAKSGTTTLELALAGTPHVVAYRMHPVTYLAARRLVTVRWIGLVNLVLDRAVVPELLQEAVTPEALATAARPLFETAGEAATAQRAAFDEIPARLGPRDASSRVAALALDLAS
jgi:lipid-A-disaccharide synthase